MSMMETAEISLASMAQPAASGDYHQFQFRAMGTMNSVIFSTSSLRRADDIREAVLKWVHRFEEKYSRFRPDSLVGRINKAAGKAWVEVDPQTEEILALCDWFHWKTHGLFDPTLGPLAELWDYHRAHAEEPSCEAVESAMAGVGWRRIQRRDGAILLPRAGMSIDLGGIGKEYAIDCVAEILESRGIVNFLVDFGHDVRVRGAPPEGGYWRLGLENPDQPGFCWNGVALTDAALCCSGNYQRYFEINGQRYGHIIDPRTGHPASSGCKAVWVIGTTCVESGAIARSAFIAGLAEGLSLIEACPPSAGCVISDAGISFTRRFYEYIIDPT